MDYIEKQENQMKNAGLRIAYLCMNAPLDKRSWSGTTYYIGQALARNAGDVHFLGPVEFPWWIHKILNATVKLIRLLSGKQYVTKYSALLGWYTARVLKKKMAGREYDCIVAPAASTELSYLNTSLPVVYISDTTFRLISNYYLNEFWDISRLSRREGEHMETRALRKSDIIIYSSQWAAQSAVSDYRIPAERIHVMPLGANMDQVPTADGIFRKEENPVLTLLFLAVYWERKGGPVAFQAFRRLKESGIPVRLIICGCIPPEGFSDPDAEVIPFLDKNKEQDHHRFIELLSTSHFLIVPTRADCSLLVACEANAYGMPAITTDTGGVSDVVHDGVNGYCLPLSAGGEVYGDLIREIFEDKPRYHQLISGSRKRFEESLNWDKWAASFMRIYEARNNKLL